MWHLFLYSNRIFALCSFTPIVLDGFFLLLDFYKFLYMVSDSLTQCWSSYGLVWCYFSYLYIFPNLLGPHGALTSEVSYTLFYLAHGYRSIWAVYFMMLLISQLTSDDVSGNVSHPSFTYSLSGFFISFVHTPHPCILTTLLFRTILLTRSTVFCASCCPSNYGSALPHSVLCQLFFSVALSSKG